MDHVGIIARIKQLHGEYDPLSDLSPLEQLEICESIASTEILPTTIYNDTNEDENGYVKWNGNDTCKRRVNFEITEDKHRVINELNECKYTTSRFRVAELLEKFFESSNTIDGHWLYVAQTWNPRAINRTIQSMIKVKANGSKSIQDPAAYFTQLLKLRKKRRSSNTHG